MGVDYYTCQNESCGYNFPDCGRFFICGTCESMFCCDECGGSKPVLDEEGDKVEGYDFGAYMTTCILCRKESISSDNMVRFLLGKLGLTYEQAVDMFRKEPK